MKVIVNGTHHEIEDETTVASLLEHLDIPSPGTAVAIDGAIVSRDLHATHKLSCGDDIVIIRAIGGG
jgi:sulfur carrier protein